MKTWCIRAVAVIAVFATAMLVGAAGRSTVPGASGSPAPATSPSSGASDAAAARRPAARPRTAGARANGPLEAPVERAASAFSRMTEPDALRARAAGIRDSLARLSEGCAAAEQDRRAPPCEDMEAFEMVMDAYAAALEDAAMLPDDDERRTAAMGAKRQRDLGARASETAWLLSRDESRRSLGDREGLPPARAGDPDESE